MPTYEYICAQCGYEHEQFHRMSEVAEPCMKCGRQACVKRVSLVAVKPPADSGWEHESGGRGRYISQMAKYAGDPSAYHRSQSSAIEAAKKKGYTVTRGR